MLAHLWCWYTRRRIGTPVVVLVHLSSCWYTCRRIGTPVVLFIHLSSCAYTCRRVRTPAIMWSAVSASGRDLWVLAIGESVRDHVQLRPETKYVGNIHGNEVRAVIPRRAVLPRSAGKCPDQEPVMKRRRQR